MNDAEIRSLPGASLPRIYMAGRMGLYGAHNKTPGLSYRPFDILAREIGDNDPVSPIQRRELFGVPFEYTGPWQADASHHGITDCGAVEERTIVERAKSGIDQCDVFFGLLDGCNCGTLAEIGYANGIGKPIIIGVPREPLWTEEFWFSIAMADIRLLGTIEDILRQFAALLALPAKMGAVVLSR